ncbi:putative RNA-binding Zn ribbon-like protein [Murinocardiopsis flavida]|uniref:Putative RNA-binding Zn ribbon-like protein n=1 Tax=Murinocardiopsis flavida TaxID=645275 RepID=A0A2P8DS72_9ACTN|nr:CGNR zinc finger domain-containing protein [Murinocardiopsis flavida]PSL00058.1 putative RNA-binding Zn ribbon-like protein [Murinocardiopsis flavida]
MKIPLNDYSMGAAVATDLVNTAPIVQKAGDTLPDPAALADFLAAHGLDLGLGGGPTEDDVERVHALRGEVRTLVESAGEADSVQGANALAARAGGSPALDRDADGRWQWFVAPAPQASIADGLAFLIGTGLLGVVRTLSHDRFRSCASPVCEGVFVDTSRAGRRRYCMPELCGNRVNVARYRARRREDAS